MEFDYYDYECHERGCDTEVTTSWPQANSDREETWPGVISDLGELDNTAWWTANNDEWDTETEASGLLSRHNGEARGLLDSSSSDALSYLPKMTEAAINKPPITCLEELEIWDESNDESVDGNDL